PAYIPGGLPGAFTAQGRWRPHLAEGFTLICLQRLSWPYVGYPAVPLARQLAHQRYVPPNPLVLGRELLKSPAPTTDRDRPVSRRSKPSSTFVQRFLVV